MSTIADPAATTPGTTPPPHRPVWITGLTMATAGAVGYLILLTLALGGADQPHSEIKALLRSLSIMAMVFGGLVALQVWSLRRRLDDMARLRRDVRDMAITEVQTSTRLGWLIMRLGKRTPVPTEIQPDRAMHARVAMLEQRLAELTSPNVIDFETSRALASIQRRLSDDDLPDVDDV